MRRRKEATQTANTKTLVGSKCVVQKIRRFLVEKEERSAFAAPYHGEPCDDLYDIDDDELVADELDDRLGEMPPHFNRRHRRVCCWPWIPVVASLVLSRLSRPSFGEGQFRLSEATSFRERTRRSPLVGVTCRVPSVPPSSRRWQTRHPNLASAPSRRGVKRTHTSPRRSCVSLSLSPTCPLPLPWPSLGLIVPSA